MKSPFPWFGGKSKVAALIWERFGVVRNYVEPFFGSGAVLLDRPGGAQGVETVNDADGLLANFWRAMVADPEAVAHHADWPVNEADLHARHLWLLGQRERITEQLMGDPEFCDPKAAGWWVWGCCAWIGSGWCSGNGPWVAVDGVLTLGDPGQGINRQLPHLGNPGRGINRQLPHLGNPGRGVDEVLSPVAERMRHVRVCCGDWSRVLGDSPLAHCAAPVAVFLDPPYAQDERSDLYSVETDVSAQVREWAIDHGNDPDLRIALCGYDGEHRMPADWSVVEWATNGGFGSQGNGRGRANARRERIWFSPHCEQPRQMELL